MDSDLQPHQREALKQLLHVLINGTYKRNKNGTIAQFLTVLLACTDDKITAREIATALGQNESSVSRNIKALGPEGTGCLETEGRVFRPSQDVIDDINAMFPRV